jgi:S1-C subfamily serine protease
MMRGMMRLERQLFEEPSMKEPVMDLRARRIKGLQRDRSEGGRNEPLFIDSILNGPTLPPAGSDHSKHDGALDAYSATITRVVDELAPSVVNLQVMRRVMGGRRVDGSGSGVVITPDGYMLTSAHVVHGMDEGIVSFTDGREFDFEIIGADALSDLAVLRTQASDLVPAQLGNAGALRVGQLVVALGNPLGFAGSVTAGIVSALGRSFPARSGDHIRFIENVIQTDAALHPGNSGGALADGHGEVVGINTALVGANAGQGLGLAVPINEATRKIIAALMRDGRVRRAFLGIAGGPRPLPPRLSDRIGRDRGIEVVHVEPGGPGARAGLAPEDIVIEIKGEPVQGMDDVQRLMDMGAIGRRIPVRIYRNGAEHEVVVIPSELRAG